MYLLTLQKNFKSRVVGQNSQTPQGDRNLLTSLGNSDWNFRLARDEVACSAGVFFKARDHKFAAILTA